MHISNKLIVLLFILFTVACVPTQGAQSGPIAQPNFERVELPTDLRPRGLGQTYYVGTPPGESALYLVGLEGKERTLISETGAWGEAVLTESAVYWIDDAGHVQEFRIASKEIRQLTTVDAERFGLDGNGRWLVWQDKRNETGNDSIYAADIYAYDLINRKEIAVAVADGAQTMPAVWENRVVWADNRSSALHGAPLEGCANCPDNPFGIYMHDLLTGESTALVEDGKHNTQPTINNGRVAWLTIGEGIRVMDLQQWTVETVVSYQDGMRQPALFNDRLYYTVSQDCDVILVDESGSEVTRDTGLYRTQIDGKHTVQLTSYTEPYVLYSPDGVLIAEGCMTGYDTIYLLKDI